MDSGELLTMVPPQKEQIHDTITYLPISRTLFTKDPNAPLCSHCECFVIAKLHVYRTHKQKFQDHSIYNNNNFFDKNNCYCAIQKVKIFLHLELFGCQIPLFCKEKPSIF